MLPWHLLERFTPDLQYQPWCSCTNQMNPGNKKKSRQNSDLQILDLRVHSPRVFAAVWFAAHVPGAKQLRTGSCQSANVRARVHFGLCSRMRAAVCAWAWCCAQRGAALCQVKAFVHRPFACTGSSAGAQSACHGGIGQRTAASGSIAPWRIARAAALLPKFRPGSWGR